MTDLYVKEVLRVAVAQICQTIGYNATQAAPLELLQDVMDKFMREFTRDLRRHVEHYNRTEPNMDDMALTMNSINVNLNELLDYVNNVEPVPFVVDVPKFPARKDSYLNFLKPGSKEVLTRPVHVHDHLPPMLPPDINQQPLDANTASTSGSILSDIKPVNDSSCFNGGSNSHLGDHMGHDPSSANSASAVLDKTTLQSLFKPPSNLEDGDRPTREVSSVVMTTGGYISPAVEGKMPEAMIPDIIDKLMGLDAPPPPPPPRPPTPVLPPPVSMPASRSHNTTPVPTADVATDDQDKDKPAVPSASRETKKSLLTKAMEITTPGRKLDNLTDKKDKLFKSLASGGSHNTPPLSMPTKFNKKSSMLMQHNISGGSNYGNQSSTNYANMLLKKAKKQKAPLISQQQLLDKQNTGEKSNKLDAAEKTQRKYMKMLQKMAKQGKIPPELLSTIMGPDKKSKMFNPAILASMPPGPEKMQLEKLLKKQAKQRQKIIKQQMIQEQQKLKKAQQQQQQQAQLQHPPPLVPLFTPNPIRDKLNKPLTVDLEDQKPKLEPQDLCKTSPVKSGLNANLKISPGQVPLTESFLNKNLKTPTATEPLSGVAETPVPLLQTVDGKELKLSNEPDRSKLNIFKKISKQKTPKSSSPTPLRLTGLADAPIINLPSGTTITPAPGPGSSTNINRTLFPPLAENAAGKIINLDDVKEKPLALSQQQPMTDVSGLNRVFGEKPPGGDLELANKPKKRGRKPGSKNAPKIPGVLPALNSNLMKKSKKMKMDGNFFTPPQMPHIPPEFAAAAATGGLTFDNVAHLFGSPINPMEWAQNKQLQQQMLIVATAKERKEQKKKNRVMKHDLKQDFSKTDNVLSIMPGLAMGGGAGPTNEEVQNINKKLMRMDTILKPAPSLQANDLSVDTSLITGIKLPSPSLFPPSNTSTSPMKSPLKSPGSAATKRILQQGADAMAAAAAAGLTQPFMLGNRSAFPNLPTSMLSMLPFAFPPRPGLIPTPGLFPTAGLGGFPNNVKNPLLPGLFPFPNLKHNTAAGDLTKSQETEDLSINKKKMDISERSYCNVAPLVPEFLKLNNPENMKQQTALDYHHLNDTTDLPKTPKPRNLTHSSTQQQDNLHKKIGMMDVHTPESAASGGTKSIPSTPGGMSFNAFEQLMKKNDSPLELVTSNKSSKGLTPSQESGLDFTINKKHPPPPVMGLKPPITLNNEPIEVSDDSDEMSQPPPPPLSKHTQQSSAQPLLLPSQPLINSNTPNFNMDEMFVANTGGGTKPPASLDSDLSTKELKKLKKQVKKTTASSINTSLINPEKSDGVSKLAGGADLIPLASTGLAYSSKNIPFNSLTANANPSFNNPHKSEFNPPSSNVFDNLTITATIPSTSTATNVFDMQKKRSKEHKKLKKLKELKEGKIKKKKDKKDKTKSKEKAEKYLLSQQVLPSKERERESVELPTPSVITSSGGVVVDKVKDKDVSKKLKKEKKKEKQRTTLDETTTAAAMHQTPSQLPTAKDLSSNALEVEKKQKTSPSSTNSSSSGTEPDPVGNMPTLSSTAAVVPKLTLKLATTQSPTPMDDVVVHRSTGSSQAAVAAAITHTGTASPVRDNQREPSPELARISPLVTRPPKHKSSANDLVSASATATNATNPTTLDNFGEPSKTGPSSANVNLIVPPPSPWLSGGTISASSVLLPHQLLQTTKQHDMTATPSSSQSTDNTKTHNTDRQSPLTLITETSRPSSYIDAEGNRVWICPACGKVDDGSPMIGCDGCDAWYHWVCVGIFIAPKDNEDWFCRVCITRKKGLHGSDKKRKRNKKK